MLVFLLDNYSFYFYLMTIDTTLKNQWNREHKQLILNTTCWQHSFKFENVKDPFNQFPFNENEWRYWEIIIFLITSTSYLNALTHAISMSRSLLLLLQHQLNKTTSARALNLKTVCSVFLSILSFYCIVWGKRQILHAMFICLHFFWNCNYNCDAVPELLSLSVSMQ